MTSKERVMIVCRVGSGRKFADRSGEVEALWLTRQADFTIEPNMVFNIDIGLSNGIHRLRYEDGILVTQNGVRKLTSYRREETML